MNKINNQFGTFLEYSPMELVTLQGSGDGENPLFESICQIPLLVKIVLLILALNIFTNLPGYSQQQNLTIKGIVIDNIDGDGIPGVSILNADRKSLGVTGKDGSFSIIIPRGTAVNFSFMGYSTLVRTFNSNENNVTVRLSRDLEMLQEVVVIGYGTSRKESLTGSVGSVDGKDLANISSSRIDQVLQGRIAGAHVTQVNGSPGAPSTIRIRGGNSIQGDNDPLYVIDGFIVGSGFDLNNINTNDVQSVDVLKDAVATSIYGTRGANGVILITTKSGAGMTPGKPTISFSTYYGTQSILNSVDFLTGPEHARFVNEDAAARGASLPFPASASVPDVNWIDQLTRTAPIYNVDLSVSGQSADRNVDYYLSANHFNQEGIIKSSGIEKFNFRSKLNIKLSDKVRTGFQFNTSRFLKENNKVNFSGVLLNGLTSRAIYDNGGNFTAINPVSFSVQRNPVADIQLKVNHNTVTNVFGNIFVEFEPIKNLVFRSSFGPEVNYSKNNQYNPGILPENLIVNQGGDGGTGIFSSINLLNENTVSFNRELGSDHRIDLLGGFTMQKYQAESNYAEGFGFSNDALQYNDLSNGSNPIRNRLASGWDSFQLVSWLGRANYSFKNKYLLTVVGRVDGSSRFTGSNNKYGMFPSAALAWRLDQEEFIKNLNIFDALKLRSSFGYSGSQAIGSFRTLAVLNGSSAFFNDAEYSAVQNGRPANPNLKWETTQQLDIGLEAAFFNSRLFFEMDFYNKKTEDLLLDVQIPRQTGFESKLQNLGVIRNKGLELKINSINVSRQDFEWSTVLTISGNRNKVIDLGGVDFIDIVSPTSGGPGGRLMLGQPAPVFVGVQYLGTWKSQAEINTNKQAGQVLGGPRYLDTNGDGQISVNDFGVLGSSQPDFFGGFQNTFRWKNFELDVFFQGTYGNEIFNSLTQSAFFGRAESNKYAEVIDRWSPANPTSDIPKAGAISTLASVFNNSKMIEDGSHLRLKNLQFTYNLPVKKIGLNGFKNMAVYFSGTNLLLMSKFRLFDPEVSGYGSDNIATGFSSGEYPYGRTLSFGIRAAL